MGASSGGCGSETEGMGGGYLGRRVRVVELARGLREWEAGLSGLEGALLCFAGGCTEYV